MAFVRNSRTGKTANVPDHYLSDPVLGKDLVPADAELIQAAPKKENKKKNWLKPETSETKEQPAPEVNINEDKDTEDAY